MTRSITTQMAHQFQNPPLSLDSIYLKSELVHCWCILPISLVIYWKFYYQWVCFEIATILAKDSPQLIAYGKILRGYCSNQRSSCKVCTAKYTLAAIENAVLVSPFQYLSIIFCSQISHLAKSEGFLMLTAPTQIKKATKSSNIGFMSNRIYYKSKQQIKILLQVIKTIKLFIKVDLIWLLYAKMEVQIVQIYYCKNQMQQQKDINHQQAKTEEQPKQQLAESPVQQLPSTQEIKEKSQLQIVRQQLLSMQFQSNLVNLALSQTQDLEKAIQIIISLLEEEDIKHVSNVDSIQMILLVRMDLKMGPGKIAAQCAHATLKAFQMARQKAEVQEKYSLTFINWLETGQQKIAYQVQNQSELFGLIKQFREMGINTCYIRDAGRTQIAAGSSTVGGIGPFSSKAMQAITNNLKKL